MRDIRIVIPCFNEAARLSLPALRDLVSHGRVGLILVDDGSTDGTGTRLEEIAAKLGPAAEVLALRKNAGKGEAVRQGLLKAVASGASAVGYLDADMATPPEEALRLIDILLASDDDAVMGSRVALLGHDIRRSTLRHYFGRIFATAASLTLDLAVYDTQCGAKLFRVDSCLGDCLAEPFVSAWAFDVELLGRLARHPGRGRPAKIREVPLRVWHDEGKSHLGFPAMIGAALDLIRIRRRLAAFGRR